MTNSKTEKAPTLAGDAFSARIEDAVLSASIEVTRQLQRRWPAGKAPVAHRTRAAYRELARRKRMFDEALAATDRLRKQLATPPHGIAQQDRVPQAPLTKAAPTMTGRSPPLSERTRRRVTPPPQFRFLEGGPHDDL